MPLSNYIFFQKKGSPNFVLPQKRTLQTIHEFQNNLEKIATIATLATNQEPTLKQFFASPTTGRLTKQCLLRQQGDLQSTCLLRQQGDFAK